MRQRMDDARHKCEDCSAMIRVMYPACVRCRAKRNAKNLCAWCKAPIVTADKPDLQYCRECRPIAAAADNAVRASTMSIPEPPEDGFKLEGERHSFQVTERP